MRAIAAPLAAAALAGCGWPAQMPRPAAVSRLAPPALEIRPLATALPPGATVAFGLAHLTSDVATLAVGLFDRGAAVPVFGYFSAGASGMTADMPLAPKAFAALCGAIGSRVPVAGVDTGDRRRYLLRAVDVPGDGPPPVRFSRFPRLTGGAVPRAYNLFAAAYDESDVLIGYSERDVGAADLEAGTVAFDLALDRGVGELHASGTVSGSEANPLDGVDWLLVGLFDAGDAPRLGYVQDGAGNVPLAASRPWFPPLASALASAGLADTGAIGRYCIRAFAGPLQGGPLSVRFRHLPPGSPYRPFTVAIEGDAPVGSLVSGPQDVLPDATASAALGDFVTD